MRKPITAVLAVTLAGGVLGAPAAGAAPVKITLLTGDQVLVGGGRAGAARGGAVRCRSGSTPAAATSTSCLATPPSWSGPGALQRHEPAAPGLRRRAPPHVPLLVRQAGPAVAARTGVVAKRTTLGYTALDEPKSDATTFWNQLTAAPATLSAGTAKVWLNAKVHATLDQSVPQIGAPARGRRD
ncbi:MAG: hypothetical protein QOI78_137 [Actinomycetota bacterium]|nr:hypothetical protein [Actinomycetota bacterium]